MTDVRDGVTIRYTPPGREPHRVVYEPLSDGDWLRRTERWTGDHWHHEGQERVTSLQVSDRRRHA